MKKQFLLLASLRFVKLSLTVAALMLYARSFGIGVQMDSWVFASGIAASVLMALWGPVNEIIRSRFVRMTAEFGEARARSSGYSLLLFTSTVSAFVCIGAYLGAPWIVDSLYATKNPEAQRLALNLFLLMLPSIVIGQALSLGTAYMNCYDVIYLPEFMGVASAVLNLLCVLTLTPQVGIYSLVFGYYLGAGISLLLVLQFLFSRGFLSKMAELPALLQDARAAILFAAPLFFSYGAGQMNGVLEKYIASLMGVGVMSSVNYASQIKSTLQAVLTSVMFSLIVPRLTHAALQQGRAPFERMLLESQRVAMTFLLIVVPFAFGAAEPLAAFIFGVGHSSRGSLREMTLLIRLYVAALVPVVLYLVYGVALLAQQKGSAYAALGVASQLLSALLSVALFRSIGSTVFAFALIVSHLAAAMVMLALVDITIRRALMAQALAFCAMFAAASAAVMLAYPVFANGTNSNITCLTLLGLAYGLAGLVVFLSHSKWKAMQVQPKAEDEVELK